MNRQSISIFGCGWLGLPLAQHLLALGFVVKGSSTTKENLVLLQESQIKPFHIVLSPELRGNDADLFFQSKILFLNIPFRRNLKRPVYYKQQIDAVIPYINASPIEFVIFASSTSVYRASVKEAVEDTAIVADNPRCEVLQSIEQDLLGQQGFKTTVIRFAGLYGGNRKIGRMLAGRTGLGEAQAPVNLIHLDDCIEIVTRIIQQDTRGEIFNAVSDGHPTRKELYRKAALHYHFEPPEFIDQPQTRVKIVSNTKVKRQLNYSFKYPNPMNF